MFDQMFTQQETERLVKKCNFYIAQRKMHPDFQNDDVYLAHWNIWASWIERAKMNDNHDIVFYVKNTEPHTEIITKYAWAKFILSKLRFLAGYDWENNEEYEEEYKDTLERAIIHINEINNFVFNTLKLNLTIKYPQLEAYEYENKVGLRVMIHQQSFYYVLNIEDARTLLLSLFELFRMW